MPIELSDIHRRYKRLCPLSGSPIQHSVKKTQESGLQLERAIVRLTASLPDQQEFKAIFI